MWKSWLLSLFLFTCSYSIAFGQANNKNYLEFTLTTSPNFTLNSATLLENPQTITNAFYLTVRNERRNCIVYASIPSGITTSASTSMASSNIILKYRSTNCPSAQQISVTTTDIPMSSSNSQLFQQDNKGGLIANWFYDVKIPALGYSYAPGTYHFTLQFTMTQP